MLDTFKARLKAKSTAAGVNNLSTKRIDAIAAKLHSQFPDLTEEADHDTRIDGLFSADDFKEMGSFDDYQRTKAARDAKNQTQQNQQSQNSDTTTQQTTQQQSQDDQMPAWFKTYAAKIDKMESEKAITTLRQMASDLLKDVPEKFWNKRALPDSEEGLTTFADEVKADYAELVQESTEKGLTVLSTKPASGGSDQKDKAVSTEIKNFVEKNKPATKN